MLEVILSVSCVALIIFLIFQGLLYRSNRKQLTEYKALFELSDQSFKEAQSKVQELLESTSYKDVLLERGTNALTFATNKLQEQINFVQHLSVEIGVLKQKIEFQEGQYAKLMSQKKSSETRVGLITEQIAPFLADYPLNPSNARFIGSPIDIISFDSDKITFIEVKSGHSQLTKRQRQIRDMVKEGKVEFLTYRIKGD